MAKYTYRCPSCQEKFTISLREEPRFCPLCGYDTAADEAAEQARLSVMFATQQPPHYANKPIRGVVDGLYDEMSAKSELRAAAAADMAGVPVAEMSALKMTDMKDNLREGDAANVITAEARAAAARLGMGAADAPIGHTRNEKVINFARAGASSGPYARAGMGMLQQTQQQFFGRTPEHFSGK